MKVVLMGPPRSGKSCFREGLKKVIRGISGAPYPYVITACPDGEGSWFQEAVEKNSQNAFELKKAYKGKFTEAFVKQMEDAVKNCKLPLTIVDIGGLISDENRRICANATHAIILSGDLSKIDDWVKFCNELQLEIIAVVHSDYNGLEDKPDASPMVVHHLERGENLQDRPTIKKIGQILVDLAVNQ